MLDEMVSHFILQSLLFIMGKEKLNLLRSFWVVWFYPPRCWLWRFVSHLFRRKRQSWEWLVIFFCLAILSIVKCYICSSLGRWNCYEGCLVIRVELHHRLFTNRLRCDFFLVFRYDIHIIPNHLLVNFALTDYLLLFASRLWVLFITCLNLTWCRSRLDWFEIRWL